PSTTGPPMIAAAQNQADPPSPSISGSAVPVFRWRFPWVHNGRTRAGVPRPRSGSVWRPGPADCGGDACRLFLRSEVARGGRVAAEVVLSPRPVGDGPHPEAPSPARPPPPGVLAVIAVFLVLCLVPAVAWIILQFR